MKLLKTMKKKLKSKNELAIDKDVKKNQHHNSNREILIITYIFIGLFIMLIGYFTNFMVLQSKDVINNPYNKRQDLLAKRIIRGKILGSEKEVLAYTIENEDGTNERIYPYKNLFSHIVGRTLNGKTGIESSENFILLTSNANPIKKVMNELAGEKNIGDNVITTLDVDLQNIASDALGDKKGAIIVMEPSTGKILAMVSKPNYDPNNIANDWEGLVEDSKGNSALINRATQGLYPPGSIFKILTALEYMRENEDYIKYRYNCTGKGIFNDVLINCYNHTKHGEVDLIESFAKSCNTSFSNMGLTLDLDSFKRLCEDFLFNNDLPTNLPYNKSSFVLDGKSNVSDIAQTAIGQGKTQISPFHATLIVSAIANAGTLMKPYVIDRVENYNGDIIKKYMPSSYSTIISSSEASSLTKMMRSVVTDGTATALNNNKYTVAGKTGSAEFDKKQPAHAWFVGFAPAKKPKIVISVIVEGVGTGGKYAVPIAKKVMDEYFGTDIH